MRVAVVLTFLVLVSLAGCVDDEDSSAEPAPAEAIGEPIIMEHDHNDHRLHTAHHNLEQVSWSTMGVTLGENGFANFVFHETDDGRLLAFVAVDGDTHGGFVIADITDPSAVTAVGRYDVPGNSFQEVRVTPDGRWAVLNVQDIPSPATVAAGPSGCTICIHIVDLSDLFAPTLAGLHPVELLGTHNLDFETYDDGLYLFYTGQPLGATDPAGNYVWVAEFVELPTGPVLVPASMLLHDASDDTGRSFPHDVLVQDHPDGRKIAYVSHWDGGHVLFDVTNPRMPQEIAVLANAAPSDALAVHWTMQEDAARTGGEQAGRTIAWSAPEIGGLDTGSGVIRALDVTDPTAPEQVGTWDLPGPVTIEMGIYMMSPHTTVPNMDTGLLAVAHYHAGVWVLDASDPTQPEHVAFYQPHGDEADAYTGPIWWKKPNFDPDGYGPNAYMARWDPRDDTLLWVTDRGTGLYALEYAGPIPGPL